MISSIYQTSEEQAVQLTKNDAYAQFDAENPKPSTTMNTKSKRNTNNDKQPLRYNYGPIDNSTKITIMDGERPLQYAKELMNDEKKIEGTSPVEKKRTARDVTFINNSNRSNCPNVNMKRKQQFLNYKGLAIGIVSIFIGLLMMFYNKNFTEECPGPAHRWIFRILGIYKIIIGAVFVVTVSPFKPGVKYQDYIDYVVVCFVFGTLIEIFIFGYYHNKSPEIKLTLDAKSRDIIFYSISCAFFGAILDFISIVAYTSPVSVNAAH